MSHNDTIELCGLPDDMRQAKGPEDKGSVSNGSQPNEVITETAPRKLDMDSLNYDMINAAFDDYDKPTNLSNSKFASIFQSCVGELEPLANNCVEKVESKDDDVVLLPHDISQHLRQILLKKPEPEVIPNAPVYRAMEFEKLLDQLIEKGQKLNTHGTESGTSHQPPQGMLSAFSKLIERSQENSGIFGAGISHVSSASVVQQREDPYGAISLPKSRPGSRTSTVQEIYSDPLHPFTKLVRELNDGQPIEINEFIPQSKHSGPEQQYLSQFIERRKSNELAGTNDNHLHPLQQQLQGAIEEMQFYKRVPGMEANQEYENRNGPVPILQFPGGPPTHIQMGNGSVSIPIHQKPHNVQPIPGGPPVSIFNRNNPYVPMNMYNEQMHNNQQPEFTPAQVMSYLPPDTQMLVNNALIGCEIMKRPEIQKCLNSIKTGEVSLNDIIFQLNSPNVHQRHLMASVLKFCFQGHIKLRGLLPSQQNSYHRANIMPVHTMGGPMPGHSIGGQAPVRTMGGQQPVYTMGGPPPVYKMGGPPPVYTMGGPTPHGMGGSAPMVQMPLMPNPHHQFQQQPQFGPRLGPLPLPPRFFRQYHPNSTGGTAAPMAYPTVATASMSSMAFTPTAVMRQMTAGPESRQPLLSSTSQPLPSSAASR